MFVDTHTHINMMVKDSFDTPLTQTQIDLASTIINEANSQGVSCLINVGTSVIESENSITLAEQYTQVYATIGIHPNDCTAAWHTDIALLKRYAHNAQRHKIVGIGEIGLDRHYPDHNLPRQKDVFRAQIELALAYDLAIVIHTRDAADETLTILHEYKNQLSRGIIHCFSEDTSFALEAIGMGFSIGLGGTITYPKNRELRHLAQALDLSTIVLETDAPFLPPQAVRGTKNHPRAIVMIADYLAYLRQEKREVIEATTTQNALNIFRIDIEQ